MEAQRYFAQVPKPAGPEEQDGLWEGQEDSTCKWLTEGPAEQTVSRLFRTKRKRETQLPVPRADNPAHRARTGGSLHLNIPARRAGQQRPAGSLCSRRRLTSPCTSLSPSPSPRPEGCLAAPPASDPTPRWTWPVPGTEKSSFFCRWPSSGGHSAQGEVSTAALQTRGHPGVPSPGARTRSCLSGTGAEPLPASTRDRLQGRRHGPHSDPGRPMGLDAPTEVCGPHTLPGTCIQPSPLRRLSPGTNVHVSRPGRGPPVATALAQTAGRSPDAAQLWARPPSVLLPKLAPTLSPPSARPLPTCLDSSSSVRSGARARLESGSTGLGMAVGPHPRQTGRGWRLSMQGGRHGRWDGSSHAQTLTTGRCGGAQHHFSV